MPSRISVNTSEPSEKGLATATVKAKPKTTAKDKKMVSGALHTQSGASAGSSGLPERTEPAALPVSPKKVRADKSTSRVPNPAATIEAPGGGGASEASVVAKTTNRTAAAAFVAARQKMVSVTRPVIASSSGSIGLAKGTVEVFEKKLKKTAGEEQEIEVVAESSGKIETHAEPGSSVNARAPVRPVAPLMSPVGAKPTKPVLPKGQGFKTLEYIVYPAHGVGQIVAIEEQEVAGYKLELFVISFIKDKMILKVPLPKITSVGMRKLAEAPVVKRALDTLMGRARVKRTMWSRRAQEYEAKINSGDLVAIAEVVRDLYRSDAQPEQSYSERQLYEAALDRMAREIAAVQKLTDAEALKLIDDQLQKGPRRTKADEIEADESDDTETAGVGEAA